MNILLDAFGGDHAPLEAIKGARLAADTFKDVHMMLVGDTAKIEDCAKENKIDIKDIIILQAGDVLTMEDEPTSVLKAEPDSSLAVGFKALKDGKADAFVTAGNTGAVVVGGTLIVKRMKGVKRPALTSTIPCATGDYLLMDMGANVECKPDMLQQFAIMGSVYMEQICGIQNPRVGLANIGVESHKGTPLQQEAYKLLQKAPINFIGNAEVRDVPFGVADVVVADGFTGNIMLKLTEGLAKMFAGELKGIMKKNALTKLGALTMLGGVNEFKNKLDYKKKGGAPLLGVAKPVIKAHGSSDAEAFKNAVGQAITMIKTDMIGTIERYLEQANKAVAEDK